MNDTSANTG